MHPEASGSIQNYFPSWFLAHVRVFPYTDLKRPGHCQGAELEGPLCPTCRLTPSGKPLLAQGGRSISVGAAAGYSWLLLATPSFKVLLLVSFSSAGRGDTEE